MSDVLALYRVQQLELEIIGHTKRIKSIDQLIENDEALREAEAAFEVATTEFEDADRRAKDMELEIAALQDKRQASETLLYSGEVKNPKEMQDLQMELESLARRKDVLDDELKRIAGERDGCQQNLEECQSNLEATRTARAAENKDLLEEKENLTATVSEQLTKRKAAVKKIPADIFKTYNSMRAKNSNRPVSVLKDDACTVCGIEQNSMVITAINRSDDIIHCQSCGRILIKL